MSPPKHASRRTLVLATCLGAGALAVAAAAPALTLVLSPLGEKTGAGRWVRTLRLDQLEEGTPRRVAIVDDRRDAWSVERAVELGSVWLLRRGDKVTAFSSVCPHLGCSVTVVTDSAERQGPGAPGALAFACPCHASAFDLSGKRRSGPSPRDLDTLETKVEEGHVIVDFRRFRIGIEEKIAT